MWKSKWPKAATCSHLRPLAGSGHLRPLVATRWERPLAATRWERPLAAACGHSLGAATCGHLRPLAGSGHLRPLAATRWERPLAVLRCFCGHLRPLAWSGHLQPLAATRVAASGCVLVEIHGRVGILKKAVLLQRRFFFKFGGWMVGFYRASRNHVANQMPPMSSIAWGRSWGVASTVVEGEKI